MSKIRIKLKAGGTRVIYNPDHFLHLTVAPKNASVLDALLINLESQERYINAEMEKGNYPTHIIKQHDFLLAYLNQNNLLKSVA